MEKNSINSCAGNSRHIFIRNLFIKDHVDKEEFSIEYCNTSAMLPNFLAETLQGSLI